MSEVLKSSEAEAFGDGLTGKALEDYDRLREDCGLIELGDWSLVELTGEDRKGWLQGQATNDLRRFDSGASTAFCLCSATGHMLCAVDGWALADRFVLACERGALPALLERVEKMVILEDVAAENVTKKFKAISIQGPNATRKLGALTGMPNLDAGEFELAGAPVRLLRSNRTGMGGWDVWVPSARRKAVDKLREVFAPVAPEAFEVARLESGVPRYGIDYDARTLPPELGPAFEARHISYSKGCYMGQEVLMRIHSRGHTNRTWVGLMAKEALEGGAVVANRVKQDVGKVTSVALSPDYGPIAAAFVRNEFAEDREEVRVLTSRGEVSAEVRRMPILRF